MTFSKVMRMIWIDAMALRPEGICRRDVMQAFGMTVGRVSVEFRDYHKLNRRMAYDMSKKRYFSTKPIFSEAGRAAVVAAVEAVLQAGVK